MSTKSRLLIIWLIILVVLSTFTPWRANASVSSPLTPETNFGLRFDGTNDYVTFGQAAGLSALGVQVFTIETWLMKTGAGVTISTGTGGLAAAVPVVTKGRGESENSNVDMNYFFGIDTTGVLAADFEECARSQTGCPQTTSNATQGGQNYPARAATVLQTNVWYHAAVTFDGRYWRFYLNGVQDGATVDTGASRLPRWDSIQHAGIGTAMTSAPSPSGYFAGVLDEVRIWNVVRSQSEIQAGMNSELTAGTGLIGRWGMIEGSGTTTADSTTPAETGTLTNGALWACGKFAVNCGLGFDGSNDYVTMGAAPGLNASTFTLETWFNWTGGGDTVSTGSGGLATAYPLITKGRGEGDGSNVDMNYFFGIQDGKLAADFEDSATGLNHPVIGSSTVATGVWQHAAATYDGTTWRLYLNGSLDTTLVVGAYAPRSDSIQHSGLATAMTSTGVTDGFFQGALDEARIWNLARSEAEIAANINSQLTSGTGLIGRWGMNENSTLVINDSVAPTAENGTLTSGPYWVAGAPFDITFSPPAAPSSLSATLAPGSQIDLAWTDNSNNESGFQVEYALGPACDTWSSLGSSGANTAAFRHWNTAVDTSYCYRVRAIKGALTSDWSSTASAATPESYSALSLGRDHTYVGFPSNVLHVKTFTIETWFRREGAGVSNTTGTDGIPQAIPLVTKGAAEAEGTTQDENFLLVIDDATDVLGADFEECDNADTPAECPTGGTAGLNHPILGVTPLSLNTWYHAAVTFDGNKWQLFLNGALERELVVGRLPRWDNTSRAALGTSIKTDNGPLGFFDGSLDEVRIWDYARTQEQIRSAMNTQIESAQSGLVARWSLDEGSGTAVSGSAGTNINGSFYPNPGATGWNWTLDAPFNAQIPPNLSTVVQPLDNAYNVGILPGGGSEPLNYVPLQVTVSDLDSSLLNVSFYGRPFCQTPHFTLAVLPDTQYYSAELNGGTRAMFDAQTQWIVDNQIDRNILYTTHLGDIVNTYGTIAEWDIAGKLTATKGALSKLDDAGLKYGLAVGNHDGGPGNTANFNSYFPASRVGDGHYGSDNDNHYGLFSSGGLDFIIIHLENNDSPDTNVLAWADNLLASVYPNRRAIVVHHNLVASTTDLSTSGKIIYDYLKHNANLFLMLGGHLDTEVTLTLTDSGHTIYALRSDYQSRTNGGSGWMRLMEFQPEANQIQVYTFSPYLNQWETDASSQFTLPYSMGGAGCPPFQLIQTLTGVPSGSSPSALWGDRSQSSWYEWYVTISDGAYTVSSPVWSFTTDNPTGVELAGFSARAVDGKVSVDWETASELRMQGFNLYRAASPDGERMRLNADMFPAISPGQVSGNAYQYLDADVVVGATYYYWLEIVTIDGAELEGPVWIRAYNPYKIWLPIIRR